LVAILADLMTTCFSAVRTGLMLGLLALATAGCASVKGTYVWVDDYSDPQAQTGQFVIEPGDVIWVRVFNQDGMSTKGRVREDGKLAVPFLNDVQAAGYTPNVLSAQIQTRLKDFINAPQVTVSVEETKPVLVSVLGEVAHPGQITADPEGGLLPVIAAAGGLTEFGHRDRLFVLRRGTPPVRIRFDLDRLMRAEGKGAQFRVQSGDVLVVE
jgi:polysaccharide export outer membrane protein